MTLKKFFRRRTVRVIFSTLFILAALFSFFAVSASAVDLPSNLPGSVFLPPQIPSTFSYEYGLARSTNSVQKVFQVFFLQHYFGGFNTQHPVCLFVVPSGSSWLTYLITTDGLTDSVYYDSSGNFYIYFGGASSGSDAGGTVYYYLLTDYGFVYERQTVFNEQFATLSSAGSSTSVMWYLTSSGDLNPNNLASWSWNNAYIGSGLVADTDPLNELNAAADRWVTFYVTSTTLYDRQEIFDSGYENGYAYGVQIGYETGFREGVSYGYNSGYDNGYDAGLADGGYELNISSIITAIPASVRTLLENSFNTTLFGINIYGLLLLVLGSSIVFVIIKFIWSKFL